MKALERTEFVFIGEGLKKGMGDLSRFSVAELRNSEAGCLALARQGDPFVLAALGRISEELEFRKLALAWEQGL